MEKQVSFVTNLFETETVKPHFINDRCFGEDLAAWLITKLHESEFSFSEPYQEDWGWEIQTISGKDKFYIQIGIMDESIGEENAQWMITIEAAKYWFSFKNPNFSVFVGLCYQIAEILSDETEISEIVWQD